MGTSVYVGIMEDGREVAVKRKLLQACEDLTEFKTEISTLLKTKGSPFILGYHHFFQDDPFMYLISDLCEETLHEHVQSQSIEHLREDGPRMIKQILCGLQFLHHNDILHRNLKPSKVLVDKNGCMKLADFGLSRFLDEVHTTASMPKRDWMPAEVLLQGGYGFQKKSDVYVVGMISFFILTAGKYPFGEHSRDRVRNILDGNPVDLHVVENDEAHDFISKLIRRKIDDRPYADEALNFPYMTRAKDYKDLGSLLPQ